MLSHLLSLFLMQSGAAVVINEFQYDDLGTDDREYVELYNRSPSPVNISGWKLESRDQLGPNTAYTIPANTTLMPGAFYVIGAATVPNVNLVVGTIDLWENDQETLELRDAGGALIDTLAYEVNKALFNSTQWQEGDGVWGNFQSNDPLDTSWARIRDGYDTDNNGRDFALRPTTPGTSNDLPASAAYSDNFDARTLETSLPEWAGSFRLAYVIHPQNVTPSNPNAIPTSPQGGNAAIFWDTAGGGNANPFLATGAGGVVVEGYVYFDAALRPSGEYETWSLGVAGTTCTFHNHPDPGGLIGSTANGNTGVAWVYQITSQSGVLFLVDHNDGGQGAAARTQPVILGQIPIQRGVNDGWQRLRLEVSGNKVVGSFGGTPGCADGTSFAGTVEAQPFVGVYVGYREFLANNMNTRPFTMDAITIQNANSSIGFYGSAIATTRGTPQIDANGPPTVGFSDFSVTGDMLRPNGVAFVVFGFAQANIDIGALGGPPGSRLLANPSYIVGMPVGAAGRGSVKLGLPCDRSLIGGTVYWQILDVDPALTFAIPLGHSRGMQTTLGG